jgi:hypothetical protein
VPPPPPGNYSVVTWPTSWYAGWYDIFTVGNLIGYEGFQTQSDPSVRGNHWWVKPLAAGGG